MQKQKVAAYCVVSGLELVQIIVDEGVSGTKRFESRPGRESLAGILAKKGATHVVALKLDRLFRDAEDALRQTRQWDKAEIALHIVDMGGSSLNTRSAMGRMSLTMMAAFAELERNLISERTSMALRHKRDQGKVYGSTPYGFQRNGDDLSPDAREAQTIALITKWRTTMSLRQIAYKRRRHETEF